MSLLVRPWPCSRFLITRTSTTHKGAVGITSGLQGKLYPPGLWSQSRTTSKAFWAEGSQPQKTRHSDHFGRLPGGSPTSPVIKTQRCPLWEGNMTNKPLSGQGKTVRVPPALPSGSMHILVGYVLKLYTCQAPPRVCSCHLASPLPLFPFQSDPCLPGVFCTSPLQTHSLHPASQLLASGGHWPFSKSSLASQVERGPTLRKSVRPQI